MKIITLKNEEGDTIEVKRVANGDIWVRHSDKDKETFGEFRDIQKLVQQDGALGFLEKRGIDISDPTAREAAEIATQMAFLIVGTEQIILGKEDVALIRKAIKQLD